MDGRRAEWLPSLVRPAWNGKECPCKSAQTIFAVQLLDSGLCHRRR